MKLLILIIIEQIIFSSTTLLISIVSGRWLSLYDYGLFAIIYSIIIFIGLVQDAIINQPFVIFSSNKYSDDSVELHYKILKLIMLLLVIFIVTTLLILSIIGGELNIILKSIVISVPGVAMMNLYRRVWHVKKKPINNLITGSLFFIFIISFLFYFKIQEIFSLNNVFISLGISSIAVSLLSAYLYKCENKDGSDTLDSLEYNKVIINFLTYGKWALLASVLIWASNDIYYFVLSKFNMSAAGEFKLIKNLFLPFIHIIAGVNYYLLPEMSNNTLGSSLLKLKFFWILFFLSAILYSAIIIFFSEPVFELIYKKEIPNITNLVSTCIFIPLLFGVASFFTTLMRASDRIHIVFFVYLLSISLSVVIWLFAFRTINIDNAIISWNFIFLFIILFYFIVSKMKYGSYKIFY